VKNLVIALKGGENVRNKEIKKTADFSNGSVVFLIGLTGIWRRDCGLT
jgi:hypothetical protein